MAELERCQQEDFKFWDLVSKESEAVQIDFRRRLDQADAVSNVAQEIWEELDRRVAELELLRASKMRKLPFGLFVVGCIWLWIADSKGLSTTGAAGMIFAAFVIHYFLLAEISLKTRDLSAFQLRQLDLLRCWLSAGATTSDFFAHRDQFLKMQKLWEQRPDADSQAAEREELKHEQMDSQLQVRLALLARARGRWRALDN